MNDNTKEPAEDLSKGIAERRIQTICLLILTLLSLVAALYLLKAVLLPFVLAIFFAAGIKPVLEGIQKYGVPRYLAVAVAFTLGFVAVVSLWSMIWISVAGIINDSDAYGRQLEQVVSQATTMTEKWLPKSELTDLATQDSTHMNVEPKLLADPGANGVIDPMKPPTAAGRDLSEYTMTVFRQVIQYLSVGSLELVSTGILIIIFMYFLLWGNTDSQTEQSPLWLEIESKIRLYIAVKTLVSIVTGAAVWFVLMIFGIPLAPVFGVLAFLLNYLPNIGPLIMIAIPLPVIILSPTLSVFTMILVITLLTAIQFISGNVIETRIMGDLFDIHPVVVLLALLFWGIIWGIPGMFVATPVTAIVKLCFYRFEYTRPLANAMSGGLSISTK